MSEKIENIGYDLDRALEVLPEAIKNAGAVWGRAEGQWKNLDDLVGELCKNKMAKMKMELPNLDTDGKIKSDAQLEREVRSADEYQIFVEEKHAVRGLAKENAIASKAIYEARMAQFDLIRSYNAQRNAMMREGFHATGK